MATPDLRNESLGVKHKNYNKHFQNAYSKNITVDEKEFKPAETDLDNFIKIDTACKNKKLDYVLSVLKLSDILYVTRAVNKSEWLVEDEYRDIINPRFLRDELLPQMTAEGGNKLIKSIRQHLKNESRAEEFFTSETTQKAAVKWLSRCSVNFIEKHVQDYMCFMTNLELKRICEKSVTIFDAATGNKDLSRRAVLESALFLINTHLDKYLDAVESVSDYERHAFNAKATNTIMKQVPDRIKSRFDVYRELIHIPTFVKYFKSEEIKGFLYKQVDVKEVKHNRHTRLYKYDVIKEFISKMPKDEQFDFVKTLFIDKIYFHKDDNDLESETISAKYLSKSVCAVNPFYVWYQLAPFDIAIAEIKKLLSSDAHLGEKSNILKVLLLCTKYNKELLHTVLSYYVDEHKKDDILEKNKFITNVITHTNIFTYDDALWDLVDIILKSMDVYKETENSQQNCVDIIIINSVLNNKPIPDVIKTKINSTLKDYQNNLSKEDCEKVFEYLFNNAKKLIENSEINSQDTLNEAVSRLDNMLNILLDWKKHMIDYPFILKKMQTCLKIAKENNWKSYLYPLYNKNKCWRKLMFEESLMLHPTEAVCVNAIKHDPTLLERYKDEVERIRYNDKEKLDRLFRKLRIYWPNSLGEDWSKSYVARLDKLGNHRAIIRGLCSMLSQNALHELINKYAPVEAKIDWNNTDELTLSLQRTIAKNMHIARPKPIPDDLLLYAKGDYLQYALPSVHAIFYDLSRVDSKVHIPKLLGAPVSLQKHGLQFAFVKLDHEVLKLHMSNIWKTSKNSSIRKIVFQLMFELLIKEKNDKKAQELWELLEVFIDNLSFQEDGKIYKLLARVSELTLCVRANFLPKSYRFLKTLVQNTKKDRETYSYNVDRLADYTRDIMELMAPDFIVEILTEFINEKFFIYDKYRSQTELVKVLSAYLLCTKEEEMQMQRYELLFSLLKRSFSMWDDAHEGNYYIRKQIQSVLHYLTEDLSTYVTEKKSIIPTKMFKKIQNELNKLPLSENYVMITNWKLTVKMAELMEKSKGDDWKKISTEICSEFSKTCLECLKEDVQTHFSCIYVLFAKAMGKVVRNFSECKQLQIFEEMLADVECVQAYLASLTMLNASYYNNEMKLQLKKTIADHPSVEVKMHCYNSIRT